MKMNLRHLVLLAILAALSSGFVTYKLLTSFTDAKPAATEAPLLPRVDAFANVPEPAITEHFRMEEPEAVQEIVHEADEQTAPPPADSEAVDILNEIDAQVRADGKETP